MIPFLGNLSAVGAFLRSKAGLVATAVLIAVLALSVAYCAGGRDERAEAEAERAQANAEAREKQIEVEREAGANKAERDAEDRAEEAEIKERAKDAESTGDSGLTAVWNSLFD